MGALRRRVEVSTRRLADGTGWARGAVEDDFHHFRVELQHQDGVITQARSFPVRIPTTMCPLAGDRLGMLAGMPLSDSAAAVAEHTEARLQCTHAFDLAGVAAAAASRGIERRIYEIDAPDRVEGRTRARLLRDGEDYLVWEVSGGRIVSPGVFEGRGLGGGFTGWARASLSLDMAEAALVLRRGVFISGARTPPADGSPRSPPIGGCWVWQPERAASVVRIPDVSFDFTDRPQDLTLDDRDWLAFEGV